MRARGLIVWMLAGLSLAAEAPPGPAEKAVNHYSLEKEAALGKQLAADFTQRNTPIDSPAVLHYLDRLGRRIAADLRDAKFPYSFRVIASDPCRTVHEPAALPGGYVFVPGALFVETRNEAEFGGMLAHAMSHIALRHATRQATRGQVSNLASIPLIFTGGWSGSCSEELLLPRAFVTSLRSQELEADVLAIRTMARTGFDPTALLRYMERVQPAASALPDRDQRHASMRLLIENLPPTNYAAPGEEFPAIQREVRRLMERRASHTAP
jgi:beta-barrel assembly-enhancing protease